MSPSRPGITEKNSDNRPHLLVNRAIQGKAKAEEGRDEVVEPDAPAQILWLAPRASSAARVTPTFATLSYFCWGEFGCRQFACHPSSLTLCSALLPQAVRPHIESRVGGEGS